MKRSSSPTRTPGQPTRRPPQPAARFWTRRRLLAAALGLVALALALAGGAIWAEVAATRHWHAAEEALARADFPAARAHLEHCLAAWPSSAATHFLAARTARRAGDLKAAERHLGEAERLGWVPGAVELERVLIAIRRGADPRRYETALLDWAREDQPEAPLILEALAPALFARYRLDDALRAAELWARKEPGRAEPWLLQGQIHERRRNDRETVAAYRRAAELDPGNEDARLGLGQALLRLNQAAEALSQFELLRAARPEDRAVRLGLATSYRLLGREEEALAALEGLVADHPRDAEILAERGRLERDFGRPGEAEKWFRKATEHPPYDPSVLLDLAVALEQNGKTEEAARARERHKQTEADLLRLRDMTREINLSPRNPDLRAEAGVILLRNHHESAGLGWLRSALEIDPAHEPTHRALAEYYEKRDPALAEYHRRFVR